MTYTVDSEMFAGTLFLFIFVNSFPRRFKILANIENTYSCFSSLKNRSGIQELKNNLKIKNSRNKDHTKCLNLQ